MENTPNTNNLSEISNADSAGSEQVWIDGILYKDNYAVEAVKNIKTAVVREGTTAIGHCCFSGCEQLESVVLPKSLNNLDGVGIFGRCRTCVRSCSRQR